jgi:molecular chaperone GrpE
LRRVMGQEDVKQQTPAAEAETPRTAQEPAESTQVSPETEIEELRQRLTQQEEAARTNYDRFLRERAELENFKKRMQREKAEALRFACEPLIRELLPVVDNLERALAHGDGNGKSVLEGVQLVLKSLLGILESHGVKRIEAVGEPFDPTRHEAMARVESAETEPNRVLEQHHTGYLLHERLLRPALVTVSGRTTNDAVETEPESD